MTLSEKTKEVVKDSIKSAIFIDEKAVEFFTKEPDKAIVEEKLSEDLYLDFRNSGVSFDIHRFKASDMRDENLLKRVFNKDLVLLDWDLDEGVSGNIYALQLLSEIVQQSQIHFCSIYTSSSDVDLLERICAYFSGKSHDYYQCIFDEILDPYYADYKPLFNKISTDSTRNGGLFSDINSIDSGFIKLLRETTEINDVSAALVKVKYAILGFISKPGYLFPDVELKSPEHVDINNNTLNLNNTIVTIIPKSCNTSSEIISKLSSQVESSENALMELIGLDMQNNFAKNSSFVDKNLLNVHLHSLMHHRATSKQGEFPIFLKSVLIEQAKLSLDSASLETLEDTFLDSITPQEFEHDDSDLAHLNAFYNGSFVENKAKLNFGDILKGKSSNDFYLCITPLCDCLHSENIKNNFFFVRGFIGNLEACLSEKDGGFKSYVNGGICIQWTDGDYIKPIQIHISSKEFIASTLVGSQIVDDTQVSIDLEYVFTLRQQYAQRIANHTFSHPLRVGVDFVQK